nr:uncharacterized protein LOC127491529 [Oryctolagus cuniculus]
MQTCRSQASQLAIGERPDFCTLQQVARTGRWGRRTLEADSRVESGETGGAKAAFHPQGKWPHYRPDGDSHILAGTGVHCVPLPLSPPRVGRGAPRTPLTVTCRLQGILCLCACIRLFDAFSSALVARLPAGGGGGGRVLSSREKGGGEGACDCGPGELFLSTLSQLGLSGGLAPPPPPPPAPGQRLGIELLVARDCTVYATKVLLTSVTPFRLSFLNISLINATCKCFVPGLLRGHSALPGRGGRAAVESAPWPGEFRLGEMRFASRGSRGGEGGATWREP